MGKASPEVTTAMFRGQVFHRLAEAWHLGRQQPTEKAVVASVAQEGARLSETALRDAPAIMLECSTLLGYYAKRFGEYYKASKIIGVEVPIRWTLNVDGKPVNFASHLDLLYRDPHGILVVRDWKTGDADWGSDHVQRSMQMGMYFLALQYGAVRLDGEWIELGEVAEMQVIDVENLAPYTRKTVRKDENGQEREYVKGDERPLNSIVWPIQITNEAAVFDEFATRVRMARAGLWPMNPTEEGCRVCECRRACPTWSSEEASR